MNDNDANDDPHRSTPPPPGQQPTGQQPATAPPPPTGAPVHDDVWGVRPPALGQQPTGYPGASTPQDGPAVGGGSSRLDRGLSALHRSPLRRDTSDGIVGGVAAGIARRMNVSPVAVRLAAVALALFFGSGVAAYLIAWALLPDESGRTHVEQGVKGGNGKSLVITVLAGLAALGMLSSLLDNLSWLVPIAVTAGIVYYVVSAGRKKGDGTG